MNYAFVGYFIQAWLDLVTAAVSVFLVIRLGGGKLMYPVLLIGMVSLFRLLTVLIANYEITWLTSTLESLVLLVAVLWFTHILRP